MSRARFDPVEFFMACVLIIFILGFSLFVADMVFDPLTEKTVLLMIGSLLFGAITGVTIFSTLAGIINIRPRTFRKAERQYNKDIHERAARYILDGGDPSNAISFAKIEKAKEKQEMDSIQASL